MTANHQIRSTLFSAHGRELLSTLPAAERFSGRSEMSRAVCGLFGFVDARGVLREASCLAALRELEDAGAIRLPPPGVWGFRGNHVSWMRRWRRRRVFRSMCMRLVVCM